MPSLRTAAVVGLAAVVVAGCSLLTPDAIDDPATAHGFDPAVSMTAAGVDLARSSGFVEQAPRYDVRADIAPGKGAVGGVVRASLPVAADAGQVRLRYLAGLDTVDADARIGTVTIDGEPAAADLAQSIVTVQLPSDHGARVQLTVPFSYRLTPSEPPGILDALGGIGGVGEVGLLGRHDHVLTLGHWFPVWVPAGSSGAPDPAGYGDIGNFPAALIRAELTVPEGWTVIDGGVRTGQTPRPGGGATVRTEGYGIRDLAVAVVRGFASKHVEVEGLPGVTVRAWGPSSAREELDEVLDEAALSMRVLSSRFVGYPWRELDVVSVPLAAGVAGMEWPGTVWIESSLFAGGVPGLGPLEELLGELDLGDLDLGQLGERGGAEALLGEDLGLLLATTRLWTVAHEVGHEWWHVMVGNDSLLDPAVDEPLAQYSACLVVRASEHPDPAAVCDAQIRSAYEQMRRMGTPDGSAARESDEFASALQYSGVVYGKAAAFYAALEDRFGRGRVVSALRAVTEEHAFEMLSHAQLRGALADDLGPAFGEMWERWMTQAHGDQDLDLG